MNKAITYKDSTELLIQKLVQEGKYRNRSHAFESAFLEVNDNKENEV